MTASPVRPPDPEVSTPCAEPFDNDRWLFSVDWDGSRCVMVRDGSGAVSLRGSAGSLTERYPELLASAQQLPPGTVLDGVICLLDAEGRPDLRGLALRMAGAHREPAVYLATDVLAAAGTSLRRHPIEDRIAAAPRVVTEDARIQVPESVEGNGQALADAARAQGLTALLARRRGSTYHPGVASPDRLRICLVNQREMVIVGRRSARGRTEALLALWSEGRLRLAGTVAVEHVTWLAWLGLAETAPRAPVADPGQAAKGVTWLLPRLAATVRSTDIPPGLHLVALRDDIDPRWCQLREPVAGPPLRAINPLRPFSPTVLRALPLGAA